MAPLPSAVIDGMVADYQGPHRMQYSKLAAVQRLLSVHGDQHFRQYVTQLRLLL